MKHQIATALQAFSGSDLRTASIGLLNSLGYQSEKTLVLDKTPDAFLVAFDKRERKFNKKKALFDRWQSVEFLFQITDDEVQSAGGQAGLDFQSGFDASNYHSYLFSTRAPSSQTSPEKLICCSICPRCSSCGTMVR